MDRARVDSKWIRTTLRLSVRDVSLRLILFSIYPYRDSIYKRRHLDYQSLQGGSYVQLGDLDDTSYPSSTRITAPSSMRVRRTGHQAPAGRRRWGPLVGLVSDRDLRDASSLQEGWMLGTDASRGRGQPRASGVEEKRWVRVSSMCRRVDALILHLWLLGLVSVVTALWFEERWGFLILALIFGSLAAYASHRRAR